MLISETETSSEETAASENSLIISKEMTFLYLFYQTFVYFLTIGKYIRALTGTNNGQFFYILKNTTVTFNN